MFVSWLLNENPGARGELLPLELLAREIQRTPQTKKVTDAAGDWMPELNATVWMLQHSLVQYMEK